MPTSLDQPTTASWPQRLSLFYVIALLIAAISAGTLYLQIEGTIPTDPSAIEINTARFSAHAGYQNYPPFHLGTSSTVELPHRIRVFAQLNNTARFWNPNPLTGQLDQDLLSLHQFLVDIPLSNSLKLRVGKQEYSFGLERFIATREGPNTRTPYYGVNLKYQRKNLQWDAFVSHPIKIKPGVFDDGPTVAIILVLL